MAKVTEDDYSSVDQDNYLSSSFLDIEKIDENLFRSTTLWKHSMARSVFGGHLLGQALVAASQGVPENQHAHSLHSYFLKGGRDNVPILYRVDKTRDGRTYCARSVKAIQTGTTVFTMQVSFKQEEPFSLAHQLPMPKMPHPDQLETITEALDRFHGQKLISETQYVNGKEWYTKFPAITKLVEPELMLLKETFYPKRHLWIKAKGHITITKLVEPELMLLKETFYPKRHLWIKAKGHINEGQHQNMHKCYLAYFSDSFLLQTALLRLAPFPQNSSIFVTSLDHSMWFHAPCRADQWLLYQLESKYIGDGRALCYGSMWDMDGNLVISVAQEGVIRYNNLPSKL